MRRTVSLVAALLALVLFVGVLSACGTQVETPAIVCTVYPIYDWTLAVLGDYAKTYPVMLLSDNGDDPHNYQPTVREIAAARDAELFLSVGGISDAWAEEIAKPTGKWLTLIDAVELCGMDHAHHDHEHGDGHSHDEIDEHFWLSLGNAKKAVAAIAEALSEVYADDAEAVSAFTENAARYVEALDALDARYRSAVLAAERDTVLVADRFPFLYLFEDYGIHYHAAFPGCSAETEASFATVVSLARAVEELALSVVLVSETGTRELADTVIAASGREGVSVLVLHSCQSVSRDEREKGVTYLTIMEENLAVLSAALAP